MGRKSRLKRERREFKNLELDKGYKRARQEQRKLELDERTAKHFGILSAHHDSVYRFFPEEYQADALLSGKVWISTLGTFRKFENPVQGDPKEAHEIYNSGLSIGDKNDPASLEIARRMGMNAGPNTNLTFIGCRRTSLLPDAYVLSTTTKYSPEKLNDTFGNFCVEISEPDKFFISVSKRLQQVTNIKESASGKVIYKDREYTALQNPPGPIGFVKPVDKYFAQKEFRFLWIPQFTADIKPFLLECPEIISLCRRIS